MAVYNHMDETRANHASADLADRMEAVLTATKTDERLPDDTELKQFVLDDEQEQVIDALVIENLNICGIVSIPDIGVELSVIMDWSYAHLKISACRFSGTPDGQMILLAHNYSYHFGGLKDLEPGDAVTFTDANGAVYNYAVMRTEAWATDQLREIIAGDDWDLTLFTCTYGGASRVTVRCERVEA